MRFFGALILLLHGVAHLVGFRAAFWPTPGKSLRTILIGGLASVGDTGARSFGFVWLGLALGFMACAGLVAARSAQWTSVALWLALTSSVMCALFWPEARVGLLVNVALLLIALWFTRGSSGYLARVFEREVTSAALPSGPERVELVDDAMLERLPPVVRRYLRFMGVVSGKPRDWSLRARFQARFRRSPGQWLACEAWQYDTRFRPARFFYMQLALAGVLPVTVRDTYVRGQGRMLARAFDAIHVVDGQGYEIDVGELVTYLNDAILMAPSLLLGPETTWAQVDQGSFDVTLHDGALGVTARVWIDERGAATDFSSKDRFFDTPAGKRVRTEWRTPVSGWQDIGGRKLPTHAQAVWHLPNGPFAYADFTMDPSRIAFNVPPI
jgi:hypothetical protein